MDGKYESGRIGNFKSKIKTTQTTKKYDARTHTRKENESNSKKAGN